MKYHLFKKYKVNIEQEEFYKQFDSIKNKNNLNFQKQDNVISFYTNNIQNLENISFENQHKKFLVRRVVPHFLLIISIIIIILVFLLSPYYIREVKYEKNSIVDQAIYDDVQKYILKNIKQYDLKKYQKELMVKYSHYSWIGLEKRGSILYLSIEINFMNSVMDDYNSISGVLVSGYDAYIKSIVVRRGKSLVETNQIVRFGEPLVSGIVKDKKVSPKAEIIGEVLYYKTIKISKQKTIMSYNGNLKVHNNILLGKMDLINEKIPFNSYKTHQKNIFSISKFLKIRKIYYYELEEFVINYDYDSALNFAKSTVYYDLEKQRTSELEKIIDINVLKVTETSDEFIICLMIKVDKNIVVFKEY